MEYLVFPFGKYKGVKLEDLPSTYIVLALEKFELPDELNGKLFYILLGRFKVYSKFLSLHRSLDKKSFVAELSLLSNNYEPTPF